MRRVTLSIATAAALIATTGAADAQKKTKSPIVLTNPSDPPRDPSNPPPPPATKPTLPPASPV